MENNNIVNDTERIVKENAVQIIESNGRTFATKSLVEIEEEDPTPEEIAEAAAAADEDGVVQE